MVEKIQGNLEDSELEGLENSLRGVKAAPKPAAVKLDDDEIALEKLLRATPAPPAKKPASVGPAVGALNNAEDEGTVSGIAKGGATAAIKGVGNAVGFAQGLNRLVDYVTGRIESKITGKTMEEIGEQRAANEARMNVDGNLLTRARQATNPLEYLPTPEAVSGPILAQTGEYKPESALGRMAQTGAEAVVSAFGPGSLAGRLPRSSLIGPTLPQTNPLSATAAIAPTIGLGGAAAQGVTDVTGDPLLGAAGGLAAGGLASATRSGLTGGGMNAERAALAQRARDAGIPLGIGNISPSPAIKFLADVAERFPLSGGGRAREAQQVGLNQAVAREMGERAEALTPAVMQRARTRLGREFDAFNNNAITADRRLSTDLSNIATEASQVVAQSELNPLLTQIRNIAAKVDPATSIMDAQAYHNLIKKGSPLDVATNSRDSNIAHYAGRIKDALGDALERSLPADRVAAFQQTRYQYKVMKTIEDAVEKTVDGNISPALLMGAVRKSFGDMAYNGGGNMGDLARIGQLMKPPQNSGTPERLMMMGALGSPLGIANALGNGMSHPLTYALPASAIGGGAFIARGINNLMRGDSVAGSILANNAIGNALGNQGTVSALAARVLPRGPAFGVLPGQAALPIPITDR